MSNAEQPAPAGPSQPDWLSNLGKYRQQLVYGLIGAAIVFAVLTGWVASNHWQDYASVAVWSGIVALIALLAGVWLRFSAPGSALQLREADRISGLDDVRTVLLLVGGCSGFTTFILSLALAYQWRSTILGGLEKWQGSDWWQLWVCLLAMFGGLAVMLASLLPARVAAHANVTVRRMVYGYNSVLTGLLVLAILLVANVLVYNYFTLSVDMTEKSIYTLSPRSQSILRSLDKPAKIYVLASRGELMGAEARTLLDNARAINDKIAVEYLSPESRPKEVMELMQRYGITDPRGLLVLYGTEPDVQHQFIKQSDIIKQDMGSRTPGRARYQFTGEDALMTALNALEEGKTKTTIYFTQGHGELDINDTFSSKLDEGAGALRERLQKSNYEIKGLRFRALESEKPKESPGGVPIVTSTRVPDEAAVVVIAGPRRPLPGEALEALRNYLEPKDGAKKGKLFVLLDVVTDVAGNLVETGLEKFLASPYNVQLSNDRIVHLLSRGGQLNATLSVQVSPNPSLVNHNPIAASFARSAFIFYDCRTVRPGSGNPAAPASYVTETLLTTDSEVQALVAETNFRTPLVELVRAWVQDMPALRKRIAREDMPVAVVVSEPQAQPPSFDPHAGMRPQDQKPRLAVFGDASIACNALINANRGEYELFASTLAWLRERPESIGLEPKQRNTYSLTGVPEEEIGRMWRLPSLLLLLTIVGLGTGVWIVRRR
jgi:hypothetical protein